MSFSLNDLPSIKIPSSPIPNTNPHFLFLPSSNLSNISEVSTPPTIHTNSPSSSKHDFTQNIFSPSIDQSSPISTSYTINPYQYSTTYTSPESASKKQITEIICNTPNTINHILSKKKHLHNKNKYNHHKSNSNSLQLSVTPLTPTPRQDITFKFDVDDEPSAPSQSHKNINTVTFQAPVTNKTLHVLIESEDNMNDHDDNHDDNHELESVECKEPSLSLSLSVEIVMCEDESCEVLVLKTKGYVKKRKITDTLQGSVFVAQQENEENDILVLKRTSKYLHNKGITIQDGKEYEVNENVLAEYAVLKHFRNDKHCPSQIIKVIDFFESEYNYFLVMENGGKDFFDFIVKAHRLITQKKLKVKEWRKFVKYMFYQMVVVVQWLHNQMNCCHLDISLENITVQNGNFVLQSDGYYTINPNIKLKFVDFGLAEFFNPKDRFECVKYCGKTAYKAPEIYRAKRIFDARKADIWSLGVVLFCMAVGSPPYVKPSNSDDAYKYFIKTGHIEKLLFQWNRHFCVTVKMLDLIKNMLKVDIQGRYLIDNILKHPWLSIYQKQYKSLYFHQQISINSSKNDDITVYKIPIN